jgi:GH24 family phage-related lysozyme (muramidase)
MELSDKSLKLILEYEVGGGEAYYNKELKHPSYPGGASGVTIGIGYDLGYNTADQFTKDWKSHLSEVDFGRLAKCLGSKGSFAKPLITNVKDIVVPWKGALTIFKSNTVPRFINETLKAFPGADQLKPDAFGALVSLVFNRGGALTGTNRTEMMNIHNLVPKKDYKAIAHEITSMKRIWVGKGLDGLLRRRDAESALVISCA